MVACEAGVVACEAEVAAQPCLRQMRVRPQRRVDGVQSRNCALCRRTLPALCSDVSSWLLIISSRAP